MYYYIFRLSTFPVSIMFFVCSLKELFTFSVSKMLEDLASLLSAIVGIWVNPLLPVSLC